MWLQCLLPPVTLQCLIPYLCKGTAKFDLLFYSFMLTISKPLMDVRSNGRGVGERITKERRQQVAKSASRKRRPAESRQIRT